MIIEVDWNILWFPINFRISISVTNAIELCCCLTILRLKTHCVQGYPWTHNPSAFVSQVLEWDTTPRLCHWNLDEVFHWTGNFPWIVRAFRQFFLLPIHRYGIYFNLFLFFSIISALFYSFNCSGLWHSWLKLFPSTLFFC